MSILHKIKNGKKNYKVIEFPGTDQSVAIVALSSNQTVQCKIKADEYIEKNNIIDDLYKDVILQQYLVYEFLRDKDDTSKKVAENIDELRNSLDPVELAYFVNQYNHFAQENSPFLNAVSEEQFELLKKTLEKMTLNDLNGESLLALRNFLMSLV